SKYSNALQCMKQFRSQLQNSDRLLVYGTDWTMIGREPRFVDPTKPYPSKVFDFLHAAGYTSQAEMDNIFFNNAARFLGLRPSDRDKGTRGRLEKFYPVAADAAWLSAFDQVPA